MIWDVFYADNYIGALGAMPDDKDEALKEVYNVLDFLPKYNMSLGDIHIKQSQLNNIGE
jgi:hypothetical protein